MAKIGRRFPPGFSERAQTVRHRRSRFPPRDDDTDLLRPVVANVVAVAGVVRRRQCTVDTPAGGSAIYTAIARTLSHVLAISRRQSRRLTPGALTGLPTAASSSRVAPRRSSRALPRDARFSRVRFPRRAFTHAYARSRRVHVGARTHARTKRGHGETEAACTTGTPGNVHFASTSGDTIGGYRPIRSDATRRDAMLRGAIRRVRPRAPRHFSKQYTTNTPTSARLTPYVCSL